MSNVKIGLVIFIFISVCTSVLGQQTRMELGDKYFDQFAYKKAIRLYEGAVEKGYSDWLVYAKLGDCYYYTSKPEKAIENYEKAISKNFTIRPIYRLRYALSLKSAGLEEDALNEFKNYHQDIEDLDVRSIEESADSVENLSINSKYSDFGSFIFNDTLYFASARENPTKKRRFNKRLYKWNEQPYLDIYSATITKIEDSTTFSLIPIDSTILKLNTVAHEASVAITNDGKTMYFAGGIAINNKLKYNRRGVSNLKLMRATRVNSQWVVTESDKKALDFLNYDNYSFGNPALSPDNKRLFFVSCAPFSDAKGHTDIYYVDINDDGSYGPVTNVPGVNTSGRESFPFISEEGTLYFSSDGIHGGKLSFGLLDIYKIDNIDEIILRKIEDELTESEIDVNIVHLGVPFNSEKDDFAFFTETQKDDMNGEVYAYFSSNRNHPNSKGDDDVYRTKMQLPKTVRVTVADSETQDILEKAYVDVIDSSGKLLQSVQVDSAGSIKVKVEVGESYKFRGSMARYYDDLKTYDYSDTNKFIVLELKPYPCEISINHIEFDLDSDSIRPDVERAFRPVLELLLTNPDIKIRIESHTDSHGDSEYNIGLSERRALKTKLYLLAQGADENQIISATGFGEQCLLFSDDLINSLPLSDREAKHELNRRSIFIIEGCDNNRDSCIDSNTN